MSPSLVADHRPLAAAAVVRAVPSSRPMARVTGLLEDGVLIVLSILAVPTAVLLVGMPIALVVRAVIWITTRP